MDHPIRGARSKFEPTRRNGYWISYLDQEVRPNRGGAKPHVVVTVSPEYLQSTQLRGLSGVKPPALAPSFEWTGPASVSAAQMVACDSVITKILVDNNAVPIDVGRNQEP